MEDFLVVKDRVFVALRRAILGVANDPKEYSVPILIALKPDMVPTRTDTDDGTQLMSLSTGDKLQKESKELLELIIRMFMEDLLSRSKMTGETIESVGIPRLLDVAIVLAADNVAETNTPFALLEDLFETQVISDAERLYGLVERRAASLAPFLGSGPKFNRGSTHCAYIARCMHASNITIPAALIAAHAHSRTHIIWFAQPQLACILLHSYGNNLSFEGIHFRPCQSFAASADHTWLLVGKLTLIRTSNELLRR